MVGIFVFTMFCLVYADMNIKNQIDNLKSACSVQPHIIMEIPVCYDVECHIRKITPVNLCDNPRVNYKYFNAGR